MEAKTMEAKTIDFTAVNNHLIDEFKSKFIDLANDQITAKGIKIPDLYRCLSALGFEYPILKVLNKTCNLDAIPLEYYFYILIICGVDIALILTGKNHTQRNIKNRKKLAIQRLYQPKYNTLLV